LLLGRSTLSRGVNKQAEAKFVAAVREVLARQRGAIDKEATLDKACAGVKDGIPQGREVLYG
jgi:hypothetical protein